METLEQTLTRIKSNINSKIDFDYYINNFKVSYHPSKDKAMKDLESEFPQYAEDTESKHIKILNDINESKAEPASFDY